MDKIENPPAFAHGNPEQGGDPGMTLRDYFAGQALAGDAAHYGIGLSIAAAESAYEVADAMLAARATPPKEEG